jgi:hypothetical protein
LNGAAFAKDANLSKKIQSFKPRPLKISVKPDTNKKFYVIHSRNDWEKSKKTGQPPVDFEKNMLLVFSYVTSPGDFGPVMKILNVCIYSDSIQVEYKLENRRNPPVIGSNVRLTETMVIALPQSSLPIKVSQKK